MNIAIVSLYYNSVNYGGNLQAYALCHVLNSMGHNAEQICLDLSGLNTGNNTKKSNTKKLVKSVLRSPKTLYEMCKFAPYRSKLKLRIQSINRFNQKIPHSKSVYTFSNIGQCVDKYDAFITGSDLVWQTLQLPYESNPFFLTFVPSSKLKLSYAASFAYKSLNEAQQDYIKRALSTYNGVSVREDSSVDILSGLSPTKVEWVLDPTLLLNSSDWDKLCEGDINDSRRGGGVYLLLFLRFGYRGTEFSNRVCKKQ